MNALTADISATNTAYDGTSIDFTLPAQLECSTPTEERGIARDEARLMVSSVATGAIDHTMFHAFPTHVQPGDVVVVNTSAVFNAAIDANRSDGAHVRAHFSTALIGQEWLVEFRRVVGDATKRLTDIRAGERLRLAGGATLEVLEPFYADHQEQHPSHLQLWVVRAHATTDMQDYLAQYGTPIRYAGIGKRYPLEYYQTVFANETGSAEMPSAARAFTAELVTRLIAQGTLIAPLTLHTGVSSLETDERPYAEWYEVPEATAAMVNLARRRGKRVIAIGTTAVRALETVADANGVVRSASGWTETYITPERGLHAVDAILTGFHEPRASHLLMLETLAGRERLAEWYREAIDQRYLWHEFGDLHLILP